MSAVLTITGLQHTQIEITPNSYERRDDILATTGSVTDIEDALDADIAANALKIVSDIVKEVEAARTTIKNPVLEIGRKIDATAKEFVAGLSLEKTRLERLLGDYQAAQRIKADRARRQAEAEVDRLEFEAHKAALAADRERVEGQASVVAEEAQTKVFEARVALATIAHIKPEGVTVRENWKHEVVDIAALFKARPDLCVIEPNLAGIRAQIPYNQNIPGLRIWKEAKASVR